jgi:hypothetical protein
MSTREIYLLYLPLVGPPVCTVIVSHWDKIANLFPVENYNSHLDYAGIIAVDTVKIKLTQDDRTSWSCAIQKMLQALNPIGMVKSQYRHRARDYL